MVYFTIVFLCNTCLFLALLESRYKIWGTLAVSAGTYVVSLAVSWLMPLLVEGPAASQLSCLVNLALLFAASFFLYTNNVLQRFYVALLALSNFAFITAFSEQLLGIMPFETAGAFAGVFSVAVYLLLSCFIGLCLYRVLHYFSDRGPSRFLAGVCLIQLFCYFLSLGSFDFLFRTNIFAARFLCAFLLYALIIFTFRSVLHAARFKERGAQETARNRMMELESGDFADMLAGIKEVRSARKTAEYALDTAVNMLRDGDAARIPAYLESVKESSESAPILGQYSENPYLNAILATKAALASHSGVAFTCSVQDGDAPITTAELCIIANELLTKACFEASRFEGERKIHFTIFPADGQLSLEALYSSRLPEKEPFTIKGKTVTELLRCLFEEEPEENAGLSLEYTEEIISRYSGKISVSGVQDDTIVRVSINY